ncbi:MAG: hypothetical protein H0W62_08835 [Chitinophagales bacterium]|nr:hypothetical protein [Chitinophagales bacterium]
MKGEKGKAGLQAVTQQLMKIANKKIASLAAHRKAQVNSGSFSPLLVFARRLKTSQTNSK